MTDAALMDAECRHGNAWYECEECDSINRARLDEWARTWRPGMDDEPSESD